jgi:hypothetical protein
MGYKYPNGHDEMLSGEFFLVRGLQCIEAEIGYIVFFPEHLLSLSVSEEHSKREGILIRCIEAINSRTIL